MEENNNFFNFNQNDDLNYYDLVIDINSFKNLYKNGWEVRANEEGKKNYDKYKKNKKLPVAGVIGNRNVGKSYLLQKIANKLIPIGFSVDTKGLSACYLSNSGNDYVILDTAGFGTPILKNELYEITSKKKNKNEENKTDDKNEEKKEEEEQKEKDKIKTQERTVRDKNMITVFLESFIIKYCDILIFVLNQMTRSDQIFLNKVKRLAEGKNLIVVHNLKSFVNLEQCDYYVNNYLKNNLDFKLEEFDYKNIFFEDEETKEKVMIYIEKEMFSSEDKENEYYKNENKPKSVLHIIMANDGVTGGIKNSDNTEAGKHYNNKVIKIIRNLITTYTNIKPFDIIDTVIKHLHDKQKDIYTYQIPEKAIIYKDNKIIFEEEKKKKFKNILKRVIEDYLGNVIFEGDIIVPQYKDYLKKNKEDGEDEYIIEIELPVKLNFENKKEKKEENEEKEDEKEKEEEKEKEKEKESKNKENKKDLKKSDKLDFKIGHKLKNREMTYTIVISGEKKKPDFPKKYHNKRKFGKFKLIIYKKMEKYELKDDKNPKILYKNGVYQFIWKVKYYKKKVKPKEDENIISEKKKKNKKKIETIDSIINENLDEEIDEKDEEINKKKENNEDEEKSIENDNE